MVTCFPFSHSRVEVDGVRFDHDLFLREASFDELPPLEFGEGDIHIDHIGPGTQAAVNSEHRCHYARGSPASSIASVHDAGPRWSLSYTIFAHMSIAETQGVRTKQ